MTEEDQEKPEECEFCGWTTGDLVLLDLRAPEPKWLCYVCRNTFAGNVALFPRQHHGKHETMATVAWGINYLASLIRELRG